MAERNGWSPNASSNGDGSRGEPPAVETDRAGPARRPARLSAILGGILAGGGVPLVAALVAMFWLARGVLPPLSESELHKAEEHWQAAGLSDYDMFVRVSGRQPSEFRVEVRGGEPALLTRNGNATPRRMWDVWTVPGLFDTIHQEIDQAENPAGPFGSRTGSQVVQRARFDQRYGYPSRYERTVMGTPLEVAWEVVEFRAVSPGGVKAGDHEAPAGERGPSAR